MWNKIKYKRNGKIKTPQQQQQQQWKMNQQREKDSKQTRKIIYHPNFAQKLLLVELNINMFYG